MKRLYGTAYPFVVENGKYIVVVVVFTLKTVLTSIPCPSFPYSSRQMEETIQTNVRCGTSSTHVWKGYMKYMLNRKYERYFFSMIGEKSKECQFSVRLAWKQVGLSVYRS